jgi:hypothetical protein
LADTRAVEKSMRGKCGLEKKKKKKQEEEEKKEGRGRERLSRPRVVFML